MKRAAMIALLVVGLIAAAAFAQTRATQQPASDSAAASAQGLVYRDHLIVIRGDAISVYDLGSLPRLTLVHATSVPGSVEEARAMVATSSAPTVDGRSVYLSQNCASCHRIDGQGGTVGPDLSHEGSRHDAAWIAKKITNPKATNPNSIMPARTLPQKQLEALAQYLAGLK